MDGWLVVRPHHQRERWACENIVRQGATPYDPKIIERTAQRGRLIWKRRSLFPSYMFVKCENGRWRFLLSTFGVASVVMQGSQPARLRDQLIELLRSREDDEGLIHLPTAPRFSKGKAVRVLNGPFAHLEGIYEGAGSKHRERVLLHLLGRSTPVDIEPELLEVA